MKAKVSILYCDGIPIPMTGKVVTVETEVDVSAGKHPVTGRLSMTAWTNEPATQTTVNIRPLHDVALVWIAALGIRIRGLELLSGGREVAQEWFIVPLADPMSDGMTPKAQPKLPGIETEP